MASPTLSNSAQKKDSPKCINCGGAHSAAYGGCDAAKTATEIQKVKLEKKITCAQATKIVTEKTKHNNEGPTQPTKENTKPESSRTPNSKENKTQTNPKPSGSINESIPQCTFKNFNSGPPPTTKAHHSSKNAEKPTQNPLRENKPSPQEEINRSKKPFSIENSDMIVTLIMAIISVFTKDMKNIDEMYNINMIKVAAEGLLQIKEKDFLNNEDK